MNDFQLKMVLSILGGIIFAFIFILLAFVLPIKEKAEVTIIKKPKGKLEQISHAVKSQ